MNQMRKVKLYYVMPIVILLVVVLLSSMAVYYATTNSVKDNLLKSNMQILDSTIENIDKNMTQIENMMLTLNDNLKIKQCLNNSNLFEANSISSVIEISNTLNTYRTSIENLKDVFIIFDSSSAVINSFGANQLKYFYGNYFKYDNLEYQNWRSFIESVPPENGGVVSDILYKNEKEKLMLYSKSLKTSDGKSGIIIAIIDNAEQINQYFSAYLPDTEYFQILSSSGLEISNIGDENYSSLIEKHTNEIDYINVGDEKLVVFNKKSNLNDWRYTMIQKSQIIFDKVQYYLYIFVIWFLTIVLFGGFILTKNAVENTKYLDKMSKKIPGFLERMNRNPIDGIDKSIDILLTQTDELSKKITDQYNVAVNGFFTRILLSDQTGTVSLEDEMVELGIDFSGNYYGILLLESCDIEILEQDVVYSIINNSCNNSYCIQLAADKIILFVSMIKKDAFDARENMLEIAKKIVNESSKDILVAFGNVYMDLKMLSQSYQEAKYLSKYQSYRYFDGIIPYNEKYFTVFSGHYFTSELQQRLETQILDGNYENTNEILKEILNKNLVLNDLDVRSMKILIYELWGFIVKIVEKLPIDKEVIMERVNENLNTLENFQELEAIQSSKDMIQYITKKVSEWKGESTTEMLSNIIDYVNTNYSNSELTAKLVAGNMKISVVHLSNIFKQATGEIFSEYVEKLRLEKSRILLKSTNDEIQIIAVNVGYNSSNTFGRAFKKRYGLTPNSYRNSKGE